jgi:hypothetical protein
MLYEICDWQVATTHFASQIGFFDYQGESSLCETQVLPKARQANLFALASQELKRSFVNVIFSPRCTSGSAQKR